MKKIIITVAAIAALVVPTAAIASVAVDNGTGFVGKGDVQTALGLANDDAMQDLFTSKPNGAAITFTSNWTKVYDNMLVYADGTEIHVPHTITGTRAIDAVANTNKAGKLTNGWNLRGVTGPTTVSDDEGDVTISEMMIANLSTKGFPTKMRINHDNFSTFTIDGLAVNGVPLPNTPVESVVALVA